MAHPEYILVIDDEEVILETINIMVEEQFPHLALASSIEKAKDRLRERTFSCIVVDIDISGENGYEVIRFIREERPMGNDKAALVIMSGYVDLSFKERFKTQIQGTITKPFDDHEFNETLKEAILKRNPTATF